MHPTPRRGAVERAGREFARRADELGAADLGQHEIERARVRLLVGDRAAHDAFAVALAIDRERRAVAHADARREPLPLGVRRGEDVLGLARGVEEAVDRRRLRAAQAPSNV